MYGKQRCSINELTVSKMIHLTEGIKICQVVATQIWIFNFISSLTKQRKDAGKEAEFIGCHINNILEY